MIMVDELMKWGCGSTWAASGSCHLTTDGDIDELHRFAKSIGVLRRWFQSHPLHPHYDLTERKREQAIALGAVFVPSRLQATMRANKRKVVLGEGWAMPAAQTLLSIDPKRLLELLK